MQAQPAAPQGASRIPNPYFAYGAPAGFAPLTDDAGVYLPTAPGMLNDESGERFTLPASIVITSISRSTVCSRQSC